MLIYSNCQRQRSMREIYREYEDKPGHLARRFQQIAVAVFQTEMDAIGSDITPVQYAALAAVAAMPGIDQATLAGEIAFDRTTITGVIDRLEAKGLMSRQVSAKDRRARVLAITPDGQTMLERIRPAVEAAQHQMTRGLTAEETETLMHLLHKAVDNANALSRAPKRT